jgi:very-short-patch-repair endonuclease
MNPNLSYGASRDSEAGVLLKEFTRKRGHLPIRKLMNRAGGLIQKIKPCFMMSPLTIAQYLDPRTTKFDVIIFDEASQVKPEDAIGALLRGNQVVVMGDSKQLPPTSFFDHIAEALDSDSDDDGDYKDVESILNMCKRSFPSKSLLWHYRSKHESLIAVSNHLFYDNRLYIHPSPMHDVENLGLKFVHLPDTTYIGKGTNLREARAVAKAVLEQYKRFPSKSIGVGTFNIKQRQAIIDEIDSLINQDPETYFINEKEEKFFVKNIETIQGDERDIIFISVGFGFDSNYKLSRNFGALNQEGGGRRLNVLITRAREKCVVFSNFTAKDLNIDDKSSSGLKALKIFLEYAETKNLDPISGPGEDSDSPFEDSVYEFLRENGYQVHKQVGCAGYRIDLAIVDQLNLGCYLIGIECDGAQYHSSPVARDRDRLRQQILENLGWRIYRIWSTDLYRHPVESGKKLLEVIEKVKLYKVTEETSLSKSVEVLQDDIIDNKEVDLTNRSTFHVEKFEGLRNKIDEYKICSLFDIPTKDFNELYGVQLEQIIIKIVKFEGPIHTEELIQRIKVHFGIVRIGSNMKSKILSMIKYTEQSKNILVRNDFLWPNFEPENILRRRVEDSSVKIEWICDEEIVQAVYFVLNNQYSTAQEALIAQVSRTLGIKRGTQNAKNRINNIIESLIRDNRLVKLQNEMVYFQVREQTAKYEETSQEQPSQKR